MRVFASWSGPTSRRLAEVVREWLPNVLQTVDVWMSSEDVGKGKRWSAELFGELDASAFGIVCVTPESLTSEWLHFEVGAIAKSVPGSLEQGHVTPLLLGVTTSDLTGALGHFQATKLERDDVHRLVRDINNLTESPLDEKRLDAAFDMWWPKLEEKVATLLANIAKDPGAPPPARPESDVLADILGSVRSQERSLLRLESELRHSAFAAGAMTTGGIVVRAMPGEVLIGPSGPTGPTGPHGATARIGPTGPTDAAGGHDSISGGPEPRQSG